MPRKKIVTEDVMENADKTPETTISEQVLIVTEDPATASISEAELSETEDDAAANGEEKEKPAKREYAKEERPEVEGILEIQEENNFGFLRFSNFLTSDKDIYVSPTQIRRFNLKTGDKIRGITRLPKEGERFGALLYVLTVNGDEPGAAIRRPDFEELTPVFPYQRLRLEDGTRDLSMRLIDLIAPSDRKK